MAGIWLLVSQSRPAFVELELELELELQMSLGILLTHGVSGIFMTLDCYARLDQLIVRQHKGLEPVTKKNL